MKAVTVALGLAFGLSLAGPAAAQTPTLPPVAPKGTAKPKAARAKGETFVLDRVVAVVNDAVILASELEVRMLPMLPDVEEIADPAERRRRLEKLRAQVLEEMINEELIVQAAAEARIDVEASDVNAALEEIKQQNNLDDKQFAEALASQGFTLSAYKQDLRRQLIRLKAVNQLVRSRVTVTDDDVRARYDQIMRRNDAIKSVELAHIKILVPDKASNAQVAAAKEKAARAVQRVRGGEAFEVVAAEMNEDPATKGTDGYLGRFKRDDLAPEWEAVVFTMEKGEVRGPVSGRDGLHVFYAKDVELSEQKSFDEMKDQIRGELTRREMDKQTQLWLQELRRKAFIDNKL